MDNEVHGDGLDGSSLKPVSSLRARFENMNKSSPDVSQQTPEKPPSRPISPAPKPDRLRTFAPTQETAPTPPQQPVIPARPKERPKSMVLTAMQDQDPLLATRPVLPGAPQAPARTSPPSVTVQPPLSPPKSRLSDFTGAAQDYTSSPTTPGGTARNFRIPPRHLATTPILIPPRSPNLSGPPSPPPPRRSGEVRRDPKIAPSAPAPRGDRPLIPALKPSLPPPSAVHRKADISQETSPFGSPPSSPELPEEHRPQLPTRPRPQNHADAPRPLRVATQFEPPPVHHSIQSIRKERDPEVNGDVRGNITPQHTGELRPALPQRPQNDVPPRPSASTKPPPPPRPNGPAARAGEQSHVAPPKRVVSTPQSQPQQQQQQTTTTQTRPHGRSATIDRTSDRAPAEFRTAPKSIQPTPTPPAPTAAIPAAPTVPKTSTASVPTVNSTKPEAVGIVTTYPDASNTNRRFPHVKQGLPEISPKYDIRTFDVAGKYVCSTGHMTRVWNLLDGQLLLHIPHQESGIKGTAIAFKPAADPAEEGKKIWVGTNVGELIEVDIETNEITPCRTNIHGRYEIIRIYRHYNELWTLDEMGTLLVWGPDELAVPSLLVHPTQTFKVPKSHSFSMAVGEELWHATGKEIRVFAPTLDGKRQFQVLVRPLITEGAGEVSSGTLIKTQPGKAFFGHIDGKISIYSTTDYTCVGVVSLSTWKINALVGVGQYLWAGYNTGKICIYDIDDQPWLVKKEWEAHDHPVIKMTSDASAPYQMDRHQVVSLGADNKLLIWDGLLQEDWLEDSMKLKDTQYCDFEELKALFFTWNAGASTPHSLRYSDGDASFFQDLVQSSGSPDILVFGFQELVDLENKKLTAKQFFRSKLKDPASEQEKMSHQYRDWRDFLMKTLDDYMPADHLYHLLHTAAMVGLFTCVFVKSSLRDRITDLSAGEVKRGMGGHHGNKGATAVRFRIDDTSLCFINCHLAAGQSQANARHNDIAAILEEDLFEAEQDQNIRIDAFSSGGDGSRIMDHELCVLNGDFNYRIDTMSRDTVVAAVKQNNLSKLLERDQLLVARRRNPAFRLRAFDEMQITFAPTYKYDVGTDTYDSSEKKRSPAWCDRLLHRGRGRVQQLDYRRHEVRVSDHRPVTGDFRLWVKKARPRDRAKAWMDSQQEFEDVRQKELADDKLRYLVETCGFDEVTSKRLVQERASGMR